MLFMERTHLSGPYKGAMLDVVALDADSHIFNVTYGLWDESPMKIGSGF